MSLCVANIDINAQAFNGMTLYSPIVTESTDFKTYLIDNQGNIINSWLHPRGVASMPYLQEDSTLIYPYRVENPSMNIGGVGGGTDVQGHFAGDQSEAGRFGLHFGHEGERCSVVGLYSQTHPSPAPLGRPMA